MNLERELAKPSPYFRTQPVYPVRVMHKEARKILANDAERKRLGTNYKWRPVRAARASSGAGQP